MQKFAPEIKGPKCTFVGGPFVPPNNLKANSEPASKTGSTSSFEENTIKCQNPTCLQATPGGRMPLSGPKMQPTSLLLCTEREGERERERESTVAMFMTLPPYLEIQLPFRKEGCFCNKLCLPAGGILSLDLLDWRARHHRYKAKVRM